MFAPSCDRRPVQYRSYPKNGPTEDKKVPLNEDNDIRAAHERYRHLTEDDEAREAYEARMKFLRDQANREESAREEGRAEGERRQAEAITANTPNEECTRHERTDVRDVLQRFEFAFPRIYLQSILAGLAELLATGYEQHVPNTDFIVSPRELFAALSNAPALFFSAYQ